MSFFIRIFLCAFFSFFSPHSSSSIFFIFEVHLIIPSLNSFSSVLFTSLFFSSLLFSHLSSSLPIYVDIFYSLSVGWRVDLPIRYAKYRGQQGKYPIKLFYTSNMPIILQTGTYACTYTRTHVLTRDLLAQSLCSMLCTKAYIDHQLYYYINILLDITVIHSSLLTQEPHSYLTTPFFSSCLFLFACTALVSNLYFLSQLLYNRYSGVLLVRLLGVWKELKDNPG